MSIACVKHEVRAHYLPIPSLCPCGDEGQRLHGLFATADALGRRHLAGAPGDHLHFRVGSGRWNSSPSEDGEQLHTQVHLPCCLSAETCGLAASQIPG